MMSQSMNFVIGKVESQKPKSTDGAMLVISKGQELYDMSAGSLRKPPLWVSLSKEVTYFLVDRAERNFSTTFAAQSDDPSCDFTVNISFASRVADPVFAVAERNSHLMQSLEQSLMQFANEELQEFDPTDAKNAQAALVERLESFNPFNGRITFRRTNLSVKLSDEAVALIKARKVLNEEDPSARILAMQGVNDAGNVIAARAAPKYKVTIERDEKLAMIDQMLADGIMDIPAAREAKKKVQAKWYFDYYGEEESSAIDKVAESARPNYIETKPGPKAISSNVKGEIEKIEAGFMYVNLTDGHRGIVRTSTLSSVDKYNVGDRCDFLVKSINDITGDRALQMLE